MYICYQESNSNVFKMRTLRIFENIHYLIVWYSLPEDPRRIKFEVLSFGKPIIHLRCYRSYTKNSLLIQDPMIQSYCNLKEMFAVIWAIDLFMQPHARTLDSLQTNIHLLTSTDKLKNIKHLSFWANLFDLLYRACTISYIDCKYL